uniref:Uncharacterized protein n=1 Tax=Solanum tuberosum TaxID=4113 RepID=M1E193_SOLTU
MTFNQNEGPNNGINRERRTENDLECVLDTIVLPVSRQFLLMRGKCDVKEPFGAVSQDRRYTRRSDIWSASSPFSSCLQHLRVLDHWAHTEQKARIRPFGNAPNGFGDSQIFTSSIFQLPLFLFAK